MFSNTNGTIIINGVALGAGAVYKRNEDELASGTFYIADGNGNILDTMALAITDTPAIFNIAYCFVSSTAKYDIVGQCDMPNITIYLSKRFEKGNISLLTNNVIATTATDENGAFIFKDIYGEDSLLAVWLTTQPSLEGMVANHILSCEATATEVIDDGRVLSYSIVKMPPTCLEPDCFWCEGSGDVSNPEDTEGKYNDLGIKLVQCPECAEQMYWDANNGYLHCTSCGHILRIESNCPSCGSELTCWVENSIDTIIYACTTCGYASDERFALEETLVSDDIVELQTCASCTTSLCWDDERNRFICPECDLQESVCPVCGAEMEFCSNTEDDVNYYKCHECTYNSTDDFVQCAECEAPWYSSISGCLICGACGE